MHNIHLFALSKFNFLFYWGLPLPRAAYAARIYAACEESPCDRECAADLTSAFLAFIFRCIAMRAFSSLVRDFFTRFATAGTADLAISDTLASTLAR